MEGVQGVHRAIANLPSDAESMELWRLIESVQPPAGYRMHSWAPASATMFADEAIFALERVADGKVFAFRVIPQKWEGMRHG